MKLNGSDLDISIIITYEKYTLRVLSVTKVKEIINNAEITCDGMCRTIITNSNDAFYTGYNGNLYLNREFIKR